MSQSGEPLSPNQVKALNIMAGQSRPEGWSSADLIEAGLEGFSSRGLGMTLKGLHKRGLVVCVQRAQAAGKKRTRYQITAAGRREAER